MAGRDRHNDFIKTYRLLKEHGDRKLVETEGEAAYAKLKVDPETVNRRINEMKEKIKSRNGTLSQFLKPVKPQSTEKEVEVEIVDPATNAPEAILSTSAPTATTLTADAAIDPLLMDVTMKMFVQFYRLIPKTIIQFVFFLINIVIVNRNCFNNVGFFKFLL